MAADKMPFSKPMARAEQQEAPVLKVKAKKATLEEATIKAKAGVKVETITTEEGLIKFMAELEKEEAFLKAKAEAEKQTGCGSKRKPELERDEEGAAFVARMEAMRPLYESDSDGYDSQDDDPDTTFDDVMTQMQRQMQANNARWPFLIGGGQIP
ncbi:hypothetical protein D1007_53508 [Hordeum vulgare]|nr:hypothetical protein D1007_53508 [Hordeum vulgare]KAI4991301.1 hypothetical protein ZWY2020_039672 [Hordeum vulgare]